MSSDRRNIFTICDTINSHKNIAITMFGLISNRSTYQKVQLRALGISHPLDVRDLKEKMAYT